jgi:GNAT superfamily N-acetyltransferase
MPPRRRAAAAPELAIHPLTPERWPDFVRLFGPRGACAGCWCTWWRLAKPEWKRGQGDVNRRRQERYVKAGNVAGLLAYAAEEPVGWVAIEPRASYPRLARSRTLAPVDDRPVWSITCFFVARPHRGKGLTRALIEAAVRLARSRGAGIVEAYPVERGREVADAWMYTGAASTFRAVGFVEVARRTRTRPIVRRSLARARRRRADAT